ncbi:hypothetical protein KBB12_03355 [Candidatus Woesebacteria bacterium]|nr:hypothetical protein [Candidatus Woesebacteria bacterium]
MLARKTITNTWFYTELPWWGKIFLIYVRGDLFALLPIVSLIIAVGFFSTKWMLILIGIYITVRQAGEMFFWLLQQFSNRRYRPYDFGLRSLDNNAIYILYQTIAIVWVVVGVLIIAVFSH